jgi:anaerobic ribonucleoside-triphosphate reductase activating protein
MGVVKMNIHGIEYDSMLNGDGLRAIIWVSGCNHKCPGCQNPQTWDSNSGSPITTDDLNRLFNYLDKGYPSGVTFSGGDPLFPDNRSTVLYLCKLLKEKYPNKTIWMYTGYLYDEVKDLEILKYVDVLVDGPFKKNLADVNYHWAGSTNQRVIDLHHTVTQNV